MQRQLVGSLLRVDCQGQSVVGQLLGYKPLGRTGQYGHQHPSGNGWSYSKLSSSSFWHGNNLPIDYVHERDRALLHRVNV
jgi:hypothetical protein